MANLSTASEIQLGSQVVDEVWHGSTRIWPGTFFDPRSIPGLYAWYDATQGLYDATTGGNLVTANGAAIARWEDMSGNGRHLVQSNSNHRPKVLSNGLNGKNVVYFTNDLLVSNAANWGMGRNKVFVFYVIKWDSQPNYAVLMELSDTTPGYFRFYNWWDGSTYEFRTRFYTNGFWEPYVATSTIGTAWQTQYVLFPRAQDFRASIYKNNSEITYYESNDNNINFASNRYFGLGADITAAGALDTTTPDYFPGKIAELAIYMTPRSINATDRQNITNYFAVKWGI